MDLGYLALALPQGLCRGAPRAPYPRRGDGAFLPLGTRASAAPPPRALGYVPAAPAAPGPGYGPSRGAGAPGRATSIPPGRGPPPPGPDRPCPCLGGLRHLSPCPGAAPEPPGPAAAPAAPRTFEWMRAKRSPPGRSEWGGGERAGAAPIPAPLCPSSPPSLCPR